ncbi:ferric uptake regulator, Fur family [Acidimicrobium ferrooxidans DSM 10331]|uniref:Ferric uptake regulator, Fur family n=1 Tax=Acidimicrobium ferrooxidans (strain DSM 10331 / JCM 15462 / NBRC 103882 / ICP) TaxID=525909 RepID=C7M270_ACIFD|nr:Fur family transcriptional regulator [Acidimicrobium ferrooxidans]ACU53168.1 ferric uptake regulator, Fur family [Acidimicrobium ferrooxidans DSM 10331]
MPERTRVTLDRDEALDRLRRRGGRVTQARRAIIDALAEAGGHLTADELVRALEQRDALVHRATIYRTLDALERVGIIEHVHIGHSPATYHLAGSSHFHLLCEHCGTVTEIPEDVFAPAIARIETQWGFRARLSHFAIVGTCAACSAREHH